ncbi:hypothetical protein HB762_26495 (plasmid) [Vibrio campbellii]|uniref:ATP-binding protein n=1 Tax=Vibrio campbellii TaxID=680 RepID=A0ABY5INJ7_9VIBR|nr:hypothetical protein [Vibrio campbellii]UTZ34813.1 hypothetical protein HB762_26495 [Vibrio campbellii]
MFAQTYPNPSDSGSIDPQEIRSFFKHAVLVIVGEPGLGKTTSFRQASNDEPNATFIPIGEFLACSEPSQYKGKVLYLDGLDEQRSKHRGRGVMDALAAQIKQAKATKIRIACRTAEWHSEQDLKVLEYSIPDSQVVQLALQPLTDKDWPKLIEGEDVHDFIKGAKAHDLQVFLNNPGDFMLLYQFYKDIGEWPSTRAELMDGACRSLLKELNDEHNEVLDEQLNDLTLQKSSEYLASIMMLSNIEGISTNRKVATKNFPSIHELDADLFCMRVASRRRLFSPLENERIIPKHRKIAEYLTAKYLARRIREGLSLRRLMTLLTGFDGKTAPDLRGVYAWLVTLLAGSAEKIIHHDPYGAIIYGDTYSWTPHTKVVAINALKQLSLIDPWFRQNDHSVKELGGLAEQSTVRSFIEHITKDDGSSHFLSVLFGALESSKGVISLELEQVLLDYLENEKNPDHLREGALRAFCRISLNEEEKLLNILKKIDEKEIRDDKQYLRGALLELSYPTIVTPEQITRYLIEPCSGFIGSYYMFLVYRLVEETPSCYLKDLAESALKWKEKSRLSQRQFDFLNSLTLRLLSEFYKSENVESVYSWLCLNTGEHNRNTFGTSDIDKLRLLLSSDEKKLFEVFLHHIDVSNEKDLPAYGFLWRFDDLTANSLSQQVFVEEAYRYVRSNKNEHKQKIVFEIFCLIYFNREFGNVSFTLEDIENTSLKYEYLNAILVKENYCDLKHQEWRLEDAQRKNKLLEKNKRILEENKKEIIRLSSEIKKGDEVELLQHYAKVWLGQYSDVDRNAEPIKRLSDEVGSENVPILYEGFTNVIYKDVFNSIIDIAESHIEGKVYYRASLLLAALSIISELKGKESLLLLQDNIITLAFSYQLTRPIECSISWFSWLKDKKFNLYKLAIDKFWRIQLDKKAVSLSGLYRFRGDEEIFTAAINIIPNILRDYKNIPPSILMTMLENIVGNVESTILISLVDESLKKRHLKKNFTRAMWLSVGFMCDRASYVKRLSDELSLNTDAKWHVKKLLLSDIFSRCDNERYIRSAEYRKDVIILIAQHFNNVIEEFHGGFRAIGEHDEERAAQTIRSLIRTFSEDTSDEATLCLESLKSQKKLEQWQSEINYATAEHIRKKREARFSYPSTHSVVSTLANSEPANTSDLKALIIDILHELKDEIRNSNTDIYKWFWNQGTDGKASYQHINENTSRDVLLELLRGKLKHLDIVAEPEALYVDEKRADIAIYYKHMKLPIEIKRDDHSKIWSAAEKQLERQYTRDPASEGNGIYLLFWFDGKGMAKPPKGIEKPQNAKDLKKAIDLVIPERSLGLIESIVIDASVPEEKRSKYNA